MSRRATVAMRPLRMRSENTFPAPTLGSWSGSPTSTRRQPGRSAASSARISERSTIEVSSTMSASASSGSFSPLVNVTSPVWSLKVMPSMRWMVCASRSHSSPMRLAARPVGAASRTFNPMRSKSATMARTLVVLPVPGPPVSSSNSSFAASSTARRWSGAYCTPCSRSISLMTRSTPRRASGLSASIASMRVTT